MNANERLAAVAGLMTWLAVGTPVFADLLWGATGGLGRGSVALYLAGYLPFGALFAALVTDTLPPALERRSGSVLAVLVSLAALAVAALPSYGFTAVLLIITASAGAHVLPLRAGYALVLGQTAFLLAVWLPNPGTFGWVVSAVAYFGFQAFALLTTQATISERDARHRLAQANAELRATQALLADSSRLAERGRIARELHDLVGHHLTALSLNLEVAAHVADGRALEQIETSRSISKLLLAEVRSVVSSMREDAHIDLRSALEALTDDIPAPTIHLELDDDLDIDAPGTAQVVVRCTQEIITNAMRHSGADNLWIAVSRGPHGLELSARDDGRGAARPEPGNGLTGMRERLEQVGGELSIRTRPGDGFQLAARLPVGRA